MTQKRPLIKYKDKDGRVKVRKLSSNFYTDGIWNTFKDTYLEIIHDVEAMKKYTYDDIIDIIFENPNTKKKK